MRRLQTECLALHAYDTLAPFCSQLSSSRESASIDFTYIHQQLKKKGVTRELLHEEYSREALSGQAISYVEFCRQYRAFREKLKPSIRQTHIAGDKLFIDYAGSTVPIYDCEKRLKEIYHQRTHPLYLTWFIFKLFFWPVAQINRSNCMWR